MTLLQKALRLWIEAGHTQLELSRIIGVDQSICSRLINGERGLTLQQRAKIVRGFQDKGIIGEGLALVVADLRDNIPPEAADLISVAVNLPDRVQDTPARRDRVSAAKADFQRALDIDDPDTVALVLSLYDWKHPG